MTSSTPDTPPIERLPFPRTWRAVGFDNRLLRETPADPVEGGGRRQVMGACHSRVQPTPVSDPRILGWSADLARTLGLPDTPDEPHLARIFGGNALTEGMDPFAACYGGHQFGNWAGQLGDGRAISLGELVAPDQRRWELQLKGAGPTPYSRSGDGRAVLRSSLREFVCSEAMFHLGVPTTRALSLVQSGDAVVRDMFYDGNPRAEQGAIVCRVAPSFLRFGSFEIHAARGDFETLRRLLDHVVTTHAPELGTPSADAYAAWFDQVCRRTAEMIAHWMRVGFVHGVMNTDNMSIHGLTIDYGPYGWVDDYDPDWTPNTTDAGQRRYRFGAQPTIAAWNLGRLAASIFPLVEQREPFETSLERFWHHLESTMFDTYAAKLGVPALRETHHAGEDERAAAAAVINGLMDVLVATPTDMTIFFRKLTEVPTHADASPEERLAPLADAYYDPEHARSHAASRTLDWLASVNAMLTRHPTAMETREATMNAANPVYVPRNYLAQQAIEDAERGDLRRLRELIEALAAPYAPRPAFDHLFARRPAWAMNKAGCSMLSCSS